MLAIGTGDGPQDLEAAVRLADLYPFIYASAGVHPNDAAKVDPGTFNKLVSLLQHPKIKALGEIGLDYHWGVPQETQTLAFIRQLEIAAKARMPVIIHPEDEALWLDPEETDPERLQPLLVPYPESEMEAQRISTAINRGIGSAKIAGLWPSQGSSSLALSSAV